MLQMYLGNNSSKASWYLFLKKNLQNVHVEGIYKTSKDDDVSLLWSEIQFGWVKPIITRTLE